MTKKLFFIGLISLFFITFSSCMNDEGNVKITVDKTTYAVPEHAKIEIPFSVLPATTDATKAILGISTHTVVVDEEDIETSNIIPTMVSVSKSFVGEGKWVANIKLINQEGKDFVPNPKHNYNLTASICILLPDGSYSPFFKLTYDYKAKE